MTLQVKALLTLLHQNTVYLSYTFVALINVAFVSSFYFFLSFSPDGHSSIGLRLYALALILAFWMHMSGIYLYFRLIRHEVTFIVINICFGSFMIAYVGLLVYNLIKSKLAPNIAINVILLYLVQPLILFQLRVAEIVHHKPYPMFGRAIKRADEYGAEYDPFVVIKHDAGKEWIPLIYVLFFKIKSVFW